MFRVLFIVIAAGFIFFACHSKMPPVVNPDGNTPEKILFLAYEVTRDSVSGKVSTSILYQKTVAGQVKPGSIINAPADLGNWRIIVNDNKDGPLATLLIENPLHKKIEYVRPDGTLGIKEVWLSRAEVVLRFNYTIKMNKVAITEIGPEKEQPIFKHVLLLTDK